MSKLVKQAIRQGRTLYFLASIGAIGSILAYGLAAPFFLIGRVSNRAQAIGDRILRVAVFLLMAMQPWFSADIQLSIPNARSRKTGYLLVSNHRSHLDSFILLSRIAGVRILAKRSLFYVPFLGMMMRMTRQIPSKRGKVDSYWKAIESIRTCLRRKEVVHVFPEMTRCQPGFIGTRSFSKAPFLTAIQEGVPVIPIVFIGTDSLWPKGSFGISTGRRVFAKALDPIDPVQFTTAEALCNEAQRRINEALL